eukprot:3459462-Lingulodinium_polyedra.AAC.1
MAKLVGLEASLGCSHVKGHPCHPWNDLADRAAAGVIQELVGVHWPLFLGELSLEQIQESQVVLDAWGHHPLSMPPCGHSHWVISMPDPPAVPPEHGFGVPPAPTPRFQQGCASMSAVACAANVLTLDPQEHRRA